MAAIFDDILAAGVRKGQIPARTQAARDWFREKARQQRSAAVYPDNIIKTSDKRKSQVLIGRMYHFKYEPKGAKDLPYYDRFPLIFMVGVAPGGFHGINLHYLPPQLRARLMDALYDITNNTKYDESTKLKVTYDVLNSASRFRFFKPTFKHYLNSQVRSKFIEINSTEWDTALFLPTERFMKAKKTKVWSDSRKRI